MSEFIKSSLTESTPSPSPSSLKEIHFLNQGAYGCVFRPEITCDGEIGDVNYISKIQIQADTVKHEIQIGKTLQDSLPLSEYYVAPINHSCSVQIEKIDRLDKKELQKCDLLKEAKHPDTATATATGGSVALSTSATSKYISTKVRYVGSQNLEVYFKNLISNPSIFIKKIFTTYSHLSRAIEKMNQRQIIHFDVKDTNIMYDEYCQLPIFIDFGLSIDWKDLTPDKYEYYFYTPKFYGYWNIDIYMLSQITQTILAPNSQENPIVTEDKILEIVSAFHDQRNTFVNSYAVPFTPEESDAFKKGQIERWKPFVAKKWQDLYSVLLVPAIYQKWDKYGLSMTYYTFIKSLELERWKENKWLAYMMMKWRKDLLEIVPISV